MGNGLAIRPRRAPSVHDFVCGECRPVSLQATISQTSQGSFNHVRPLVFDLGRSKVRLRDEAIAQVGSSRLLPIMSALECGMVRRRTKGFHISHPRSPRQGPGGRSEGLGTRHGPCKVTAAGKTNMPACCMASFSISTSPSARICLTKV